MCLLLGSPTHSWGTHCYFQRISTLLALFGILLAFIQVLVNAMTARLMEAADKSIDAELDRLTYSVYLLTLDSGLAHSLVMSALDKSLEDIAGQPDVLDCTVELALQQLRRESTAESDRESSAFEAALYGECKTADSRRSLSLEYGMIGNPILLLDSDARIAFVLHHALGYSLKTAATLAQMTERDFCAHLRRAYSQLASFDFETHAIACNALGETALT